MKDINSIYKMYTGKFIDLSKLVAVSEVEYDLFSSKNGDFKFCLEFQLMEKPIVFYLNRSNENYDYEYVNNKMIEYREDLIEAWKTYKINNL